MKQKFFDIIPPPGYIAGEYKKKIPKRQKNHFFQPVFGIVKASTIKTFVLFLILCLNSAGLLVVLGTPAYFSDTAASKDNVFSIGTLVLPWSWHSGPDNFVPKPKAENMKPGDELTRVIQIINEGSLPLKYSGCTKKISGDDELCDALQLQAKLKGKTKIDYEGVLMDFCFIPFELETPPGKDTWQFRISLPKDASADLENKLCEFNFVFEGWQLDSSSSSLGFSDIIEIDNFVITGEWSSLAKGQAGGDELTEESAELDIKEETEEGSEKETEEADEEDIEEGTDEKDADEEEKDVKEELPIEDEEPAETKEEESVEGKEEDPADKKTNNEEGEPEPESDPDPEPVE